MILSLTCLEAKALCLLHLCPSPVLDFPTRFSQEPSGLWINLNWICFHLALSNKSEVGPVGVQTWPDAQHHGMGMAE